MAVERKYERDIDLLLAEELSVNPEFADWLKARTGIANRPGTVADIFVSKSNNLGESDLIAIYELGDGSQFALMIEDKVDAPLQPQQAERYRMRAQREIKLGTCASYAVLLCAPRHDNSTGAGGFDGVVSFEEIAAFLRRDNPSARDRYRASFLETAASRRVNNWVREEDPQTEDFWSAAFDLASREFPILEMKPLKVTKGSSWIDFRPRWMPTQPRRIYVRVKGDRGQMDLTFSGSRAEVLHELIQHLLEPDMTVHQTSGSAAVRLVVRGFDISEGVGAGLPRLRNAFVACERLIRFYRENRDELDLAAIRSDAASEG